MPEIRIVIPGAPIAKKRPRFARCGTFITTYNEQQTEEGKFIMLAQSQWGRDPIPAGTAVRLSCCFDMPLPGSVSQKKRQSILESSHVKRPDVDNLLKFVKDCFNGFVWCDDSQVNQVYAMKAYCDTPKTVVVIQWEERR